MCTPKVEKFKCKTLSLSGNWANNNIIYILYNLNMILGFYTTINKKQEVNIESF